MKVKDILSILLPKFIREKIETMKFGNYRVAERQDEVVIVFCDICNFDDLIYSEKTNAVKILDKLYRQFDLSCQENGLQKIETVGKTYLAAAGITDVEKMLKAENRVRNLIPAKRALSFAFDLQKITKSSKAYLPKGKSIIIKVGIHLGPAISGVIGHHKPQFSLIGDTVNTTSRVCSTGETGSITISREVYKKVQFQNVNYKFTQRDVEAKGKGTMITYLVTNKKKGDRQKNKSNYMDDSQVGKRSLMIEENPEQDFADDNNNINMLQSQVDSLKKFSQTMKQSQKMNNNNNNNNNNNFLETPNVNTSAEQNQATNNNEQTLLPQNMISLFTRKAQSNQGSNPSIPLRSIPEIPYDESAKKDHPKETTTIHHHQESSIIELNHISSPQIKIIPSESDASHKEEYSPSKASKKQQRATLSFPQNIEQTPPPSTRGGSRRGKKSNSFTIIDLKPRFTMDNKNYLESIADPMEGGASEKYISNFNDNPNNPNGEMASPLSPPKNEWIRKVERDLLNHIDLEPFTIALKDLRIPSQRLLQQDSILGPSLALQKSESLKHSQSMTIHIGSLRIGLCSIGVTRSTTEQQTLQFEFLKQVMKQQVWVISAGFLLVSAYFLLKVIVLVNQMSQEKVNFLSSQESTQLIIMIVLLSTVFFALGSLFKTMHSRLPWQYLRSALYLGFFASTVFLTVQSFGFNFYMNAIQNYNLPLLSESDSSQPNSVGAVAKPSQIIFCMELEILFIMFTSLKCFDFLEKVGACVLILVAWIVYVIFFDEVELQMAFFLLLTSIIHLRIQYIQVQNEVRSFNNMKTLEVKKDEKECLLQNLLPSHILDQYLNSTKKEIPLVCEELDDVTLLFADIAGFTKYSSTTEPIVVVNMLRKLFTDFDDHCFAQGVYKLYTIGDCYVCFGLTNIKQRNPAQEAHNVLRFAFDMIRIIEQVRQVSNCNLQMRIGVHTGKLYGGVVGTEIVRYDVYGVDVIVANKMESNGENGKVMVSEVTRNLLEENYPGQFEFELKEEVHIKQLNKKILGYHVTYNQMSNESEVISNEMQAS